MAVGTGGWLRLWAANGNDDGDPLTSPVEDPDVLAASAPGARAAARAMLRMLDAGGAGAGRGRRAAARPRSFVPADPRRNTDSGSGA